MTPHMWENLPKEKGHDGQTSFQSQRTPKVDCHQLDDTRAGSQRQEEQKRAGVLPESPPRVTTCQIIQPPTPGSLHARSSSFFLDQSLCSREATVLWRSSLSVCYRFYGKVPCAAIQSSPHCRAADECGASGEHRCSSCHNASHRGVWDLLGLQCLNSRVQKFPGFLCKDLKLSPHPTASGSENLG